MLQLLPAILLLILQGPSALQMEPGSRLPQVLVELQLQMQQDSSVSRRDLESLLKAAQSDPRVLQALCLLFQTLPRETAESPIQEAAPQNFKTPDASSADGVFLLQRSRDGPLRS
jgi:hypothetical protein